MFEVEATEQLSEVIGEPKETPVAEQPLLVVALTVAGQVIDGGTLSVTITSWLQVAVLLEPSVTVQTTVVVPNG